MDIKPSFLFGHVMHARLFPAKNAFRYPIYYLAFDLKDAESLRHGIRLNVNRPALMSFYDRDHGVRDGTSCQPWIQKILINHAPQSNIDKVVMVCLPRIFGYVFNPVSFWLCYANGALCHVLCEVNNTFGETHSYLCNISSDTDEEGFCKTDKVFHVSPFLPRNGFYKFRYKINSDDMAIQIDYYDVDGNKQLITNLSGHLSPVNQKNWYRAFLCYPFVTFGAVGLIHWQAVKLFWKGQRFFKKPILISKKITTTSKS